MTPETKTEGMTSEEAIQMMSRSRDEIVHLRARIAELAPKAKAYDDISAILGLLPKLGGGMSEDLVWRLNKRIEELRTKPLNQVAS